MRRLLIGLLSLALVLGACGGDDDNGDRAAITSIPERTTASSTTTSTTEPRTVPPDVIPADESQITKTYVEQVLNALYEVSLEALLQTQRAGVVDAHVTALVDATSSDRTAISRINALIEDAADGFSRYRDNPAPVTATVIDVIQAGGDCIFAEVEFDTSRLTVNAGNAEDFRLFARLRAATDAQRKSGYNPTAWVLDGLPATEGDRLPDERCQ